MGIGHYNNTSSPDFGISKNITLILFRCNVQDIAHFTFICFDLIGSKHMSCFAEISIFRINKLCFGQIKMALAVRHTNIATYCISMTK